MHREAECIPLNAVIVMLLMLVAGATIAGDVATEPVDHRLETGWIGTWAAAPQPPMPGALSIFHNQSVRLILHSSAGGHQVRIRIANTFGDVPLAIGAVHVARRTHGAVVDPSSERTVFFSGRSTVWVPAHEMLVSDAVQFDVPALSDLAVSLFFPETAAATTSHFFAQQTSYVATAPGDLTSVVAFPEAVTLDSWPFLTGLDVLVSAQGFAVVAFGDSLIDGDGSTPNANRRLPDVLAQRLQAAGLANIGVVNEGLIGNRLLHDSPAKSRKQFGELLGERALTRFDRDVLDQPGVHWTLVRIGINDIGFPGSLASADEQVALRGMIAGYGQLIARARARGIRVIGSTLSPFEGTQVAPGYFSPEKDALRQRLNAWIRRSGEFDGVIDCDAILRDPEHPSRLRPEYDSGDHLHSNDSGYAAVAASIPLTFFGGV